MKNCRSVIGGALAAALSLASIGTAHAQDKVKFAYLKTLNIIPFYYALDKGLFKAEGVDLELIPVQNGPAAAAAVVSGSAHLGDAAPTPIIVARSQNQPFKFVIGLDAESTPGKLYDTMIASKRSGAKTFKDLIGKTVLMNAPGGLCDLAWQDWLAKNQIAANQVKFLVAPFPQYQAMLELGTADAACSAEPFTSGIKQSKVEPVVLASGFLAEEKQRYMIEGVFATEAWAAQNKKTIAAVKRALARAVGELKGNKDALRKILTDEYRLPPALAESLKLNLDPPLDIDPKDLQPILAAMEKYGMVKRGISAADLVADLH